MIDVELRAFGDVITRTLETSSKAVVVVVAGRTVVVGASVVETRTVVAVGRTVVDVADGGGLLSAVDVAVVVVVAGRTVVDDATVVVAVGRTVVVGPDAGFEVVVEAWLGFVVVLEAAVPGFAVVDDATDDGLGFTTTVVLVIIGGAVTGPVGALSTIAT